MAYATDVATSHTDLLSRIKTFAVAQGWTALRDSGGEVVLKGVGVAGTDEIYVGLKLYTSAGTDTYGISFNGFTGYVDSEPFNNQPGALPQTEGSATAITLINAPMTYWLCVNSRRIVVVVKVSAVYEAAYLGYILPYASPNQYPYPLFVGGSIPGPTPARFSDVSGNHSHFAIPNGSAKLRPISGVWASLTRANVSPYHVDASNSLLPAYDDSYPLTPLVLFDALNIYGELDGCYHCTGFANAAENLIQVDEQDYLVVQNVFRTDRAAYWALKLA